MRLIQVDYDISQSIQMQMWYQTKYEQSRYNKVNVESDEIWTKQI